MSDEPETKRLPWRPTKYDPAFCEDVIEWGSMGKSKMWMAAKIGVHRDTINEWERQHQDFSDAMKRAKALEQMWWEDKGQECLVMPQGASFSQSSWSRSMAARFPDDWRETTRQEQTGANGGPVEHKHTGVDEVISRIARLSARNTESGNPGQSG